MDYLKNLESYQDEMVKSLQELIHIRSVEGEPKGDMPFGEEVHKALMYMLNKGKSLGLEIKNVDNYSGHIEIGSGKEILGILVHLDIVPEGAGWSYDPFGGEIADGKIYGRGAVDNKGPAIAALYALKAINDASVTLSKRVRLILGTNEETATWKDIKYYLEKEEMPSFGFVPDADFPVIHAEKGILIFDLIKKIKGNNEPGIQLKSITGGNAPNMVPDCCKAIIMSNDYQIVFDKIKEFNENNPYKITSRMRGKSMELSSEGVSAHGAHPEKGLNAISVLLKFLGEITLANDDHNTFIEFYNEKINFNLHGEEMGCSFEDEISGRLIFNVGQIQVDEKTAGLTINIRYPVTMNNEKVYEGIRSITDGYEFGIVKKNDQLPIYLPLDHPVVTTLMKVYQKHTGDLDSKPLVIGGGTYARAIENAVAFGPSFVGEPSVEHQKNEYIKIDSLMRAAKIYAEAIYELAK